MRLMKIALLIAIVGAALQSPTITGSVRNALAQVVGPQVAATATDQATFDRLCPLFDAYLSVDGTGKRATAQALGSLAEQAASQTSDPAVKAFLSTVPAALNTTNNAQQQAARALISRECAAHGNRLGNS